MSRFQVGDRCVAVMKLVTYGGDGSIATIDAFPGFAGKIIATNVYGQSDYYTADFHESGGLVTDCSESEIDHIQ